MMQAYSIGVIGGADGPTAIFVTGGFPLGILLLGVVCIGAVIWFKKRKK